MQLSYQYSMTTLLSNPDRRTAALKNLHRTHGANHCGNVALQRKIGIKWIVIEQHTTFRLTAAELAFSSEVVASRAIFAETVLVIVEFPEGFGEAPASKLTW